MVDSSPDELARRIAQYSTAYPFFQESFALAARLSEDQLGQILTALLKSFARGRRQIAGTDLRALTGLSSSASERVASVFSLLIGLLSEVEATPEDFVTTASGQLFREADAGAALFIARQVCERRDEINVMVERAQLAGEILPSYTSCSIALDVRVKIVEGKVRASVPVAIARLETDVDSEAVYFQMGQGDLEDIVAIFSKALDDLKIAASIPHTGG